MYAKLFSRITESSLMEEQIPVRYTFVMLLAISDPTGLVVGTDVAIARRLNMPLKQFMECAEVLQKPDPNSNSKEEDGRRLIASDGERGYQIVNFVKYRDMRDEDAKRSYMRNYMQAYRARKTGVNSCKTKLAPLDHAEEEASVEVKEEVRTYKSGIPNSEKEAIEWASMGGVPPEFASELFHQCEGRNWVDGAGQSIVSWRSYSKQRWVKRQGETAAKSKSHSNRPMDLKIILEAKKTQAEELKAKHRSETAMGANWGDEQARQNYLKLRGEIKEITQKIGALA